MSYAIFADDRQQKYCLQNRQIFNTGGTTIMVADKNIQRITTIIPAEKKISA
jgi:hypothetical protein